MARKESRLQHLGPPCSPMDFKAREDIWLESPQEVPLKGVDPERMLK